MGVKVVVKKDFSKLEKFIRMDSIERMSKVLQKYGEEGVRLLAAATPKDTGKTAASWMYNIKIDASKNTATIQFINTNRVKGCPIAILLQYGHATRNGGYVQGIDYINPALKKVFDDLSKKAWEEVRKK